MVPQQRSSKKVTQQIHIIWPQSYCEQPLAWSYKFPIECEIFKDWQHRHSRLIFFPPILFQLAAAVRWIGPHGIKPQWSGVPWLDTSKNKKNDKLIWNLGLLTLDVYSCAKIVLFVTKKHFTLCNLASHNVHTQTWNWDSYHHSCFFSVFFIGYGTETSETCPVCVPSRHCAFLEISHHNRDLLQIIY